jgi:hypothetical protein
VALAVTDPAAMLEAHAAADAGIAMAAASATR